MSDDGLTAVSFINRLNAVHRRLAISDVPDGIEGRLVWRLFSPSARLLSCELRKVDGHFELVVANGREPIMTSEAADLESLHAKASTWRATLESQGYVPSADVRGAPVRAPQSEPRAAFRGLLECADLLALAEHEPAMDLREHATAGMVAIGLQDVGMTQEVVQLCRAALDRVQTARGDVEALLRSCETLLTRIEGTLRPVPSAEME